jgi:two-component system, sensor histidine kinase
MKESIILVVEDDPILRLIAQKQIAHLGHGSETVETGEEAIERIADNIVLIFMDVGLPGMDGKQATIRIREKEVQQQRPQVPIIALTAHSDQERCLLAGMDDFLQKPALVEDIRRMLHKWLPESV